MASPQAAKRRLLIFEPDPEGHSLEWLQHLIDHAGEDTELIVLVPEKLRGALDANIPACARARVQILALGALEQRLCLQRPLPISAFARWWVMRRYLSSTRAHSGFFLTIDLQSLPLALGLRLGDCRVSGILFRPSVHYGAIGPYRPSRAERRRDRQKELLYRRMLDNPTLERVLSLDPFFPDYARAHYPRGDKVSALPDPAHPAVDLAPPVINDFPPANRIGFLLFGYIAERKGPLVVLEALSLLPLQIARRVAVLFAGRIDPALQEELKRRLRALETTQPELWLRIDNRRLDSSELAGLVDRSDVVLAPYQRFVGSSGVLLWAARAGRPVLAQAFGLIGKLTREHRLGIDVDADDAAQLAEQIVHMVERGPSACFDRAAAARFAAAQTPQRFASLVLSV
jgi:glycosyltransferase involved in cell wall biosynthesis